MTNWPLGCLVRCLAVDIPRVVQRLCYVTDVCKHSNSQSRESSGGERYFPERQKWGRVRVITARWLASGSGRSGCAGARIVRPCATGQR